MKICVFCGFYPLVKGGAEYQSKLIAQSLKKRGHNVFYVSYGHSEKTTKNIDDFIVYTLPLPARLDRMSLNVFYSKNFTKIFSYEKPDVIYQRVLNSFSFYLSKYCKSTKTPFAIHIADNYCLQFGSKLRDRIRFFMFKSIVRNNLGKFIVQTEFQSELLDTHSVKPVLKIYNIHPFPTHEISVDKPTKRILWIGSSRKVKQLEVFIDLAQKLLSKSDLEFFVIGRIGQSEYELEITRRINTLSNIRYFGERDNDFVNSELEKSYLLINTSVSEGFSNTFIQAWMRGVPVISLNSDPDGVIVKHNLGFVCEGDVAQLYTYLVKLCNDDEQYRIKAINALTVSKSLFTIDENITQLERVLTNCTSSS